MAGLSLGCRMKGFYMSIHYGLAVMANRGITSDMHRTQDPVDCKKLEEEEEFMPRLLPFSFQRG